MLVKVINYIKLYLSYHLSRITNKNIIWGKPYGISIEPTTSCNLSCPECPSGMKIFTRETGQLNIDLFNKVINQLSKKIFSVILYFQGEPYLNKNLFDFIKILSKKKIYSIISTNGHMFTEKNIKATIDSGLNKLIISIDGTTNDVYTDYRKGGDLNKVIQGAKDLIKYRKNQNSKYPKVVVQFLVTAKNEHQVEGIKKLGNEIGADKVSFKTAQLYNYKNGNELMPKNEKYSRYKKNNDGTYSIKNKLTNSCWRMWSTCVITWDGKIVPCCFDKDAKYQLGDLKEKPFNEIWKSEPYNKFRKRIINNRKSIDICQNCTEGGKIWV